MKPPLKRSSFLKPPLKRASFLTSPLKRARLKTFVPTLFHAKWEISALLCSLRYDDLGPICNGKQRLSGAGRESEAGNVYQRTQKCKMFYHHQQPLMHFCCFEKNSFTTRRGVLMPRWRPMKVHQQQLHLLDFLFITARTQVGTYESSAAAALRSPFQDSFCSFHCQLKSKIDLNLR